VEKLDERGFLFRGEVGTDAQHFSIGVIRVNRDLLGALYGLKGPRLSLGVGCARGLRLFDDRELL
jgi:hypothetical protein